MPSPAWNKELKIIKPGWNGNPVDKNGRFVNVHHPFIPNFIDVLKWTFTPNPQRKEKKEELFSVEVFPGTDFLRSSEDCIVWLGHATFFIRLNGISILTDPVFFNVPFVQRLNNWPGNPEHIKNLDYILLSHDHMDHCQKKSLQLLCVNNPEVVILTGLGMEGLLRPWLGNVKIQEAGWYQQYNVFEKFQVVFLPSRHWSKRSGSDDNERLWGAFYLKMGDSSSIYFGGDSGYDDHFKEVPGLLGAPDVCILGVGAYKPEWFMAPNHSSPQDAVKAFHDMKGKLMIPMHYGTFDLSDEPPGEPFRLLKGMEKKGLIIGKLKMPGIGELVMR